MRKWVMAAVAALGLAGAAQAAGAAIYRYDFWWTGRTVDSYDGYFFKGRSSILINEAYYPGGSPAGTTLSFQANTEEVNWATVSVTGASTYAATTTAKDPSHLLSEIGVSVVHGFADYYPTVYSAGFTINFDEFANVTSFSGHEDVGGGNDYWFIGPKWPPYWDDTLAEGYDDPRERVDGRVLRHEVVPLPAAAPLLLSGGAALFGLNRVRRRGKARQG